MMMVCILRPEILIYFDGLIIGVGGGKIPYVYKVRGFSGTDLELEEL